MGQYIWQAGLQAGVPNAILDVPYELSDRVATGLSGTPEVWSSGAVPACIFDPRFYWIVDALGMSIQRLTELYAESNQTGFIGRKQTDGMLVRAEAAYSLAIQ
jgi:HK97 family phage major capsid protein